MKKSLLIIWIAFLIVMLSISAIGQGVTNTKEQKFKQDLSDIHYISKVDSRMKSLSNTHNKWVYLWCLRNNEVYPLSKNKELESSTKKSVRRWAKQNFYQEMELEESERRCEPLMPSGNAYHIFLPVLYPTFRYH